MSDPMPRARSYYLPALFVIVLTVSLFRLGAWTLFDVDEAVFAEATKEMVESGDWLTPTYNGVNRYDKPILFYWLMALSYKTFGINEFGARFPSAAAGSLLCLGLFFFMQRQSDTRHAFYAVISLVLSVYFVMYSHAAVTDMTLTLFITMSLLSFYQSLHHASVAEGSSRLYRYGFYFFSGLAFLTKGLVGIVFPFGIACLYLLFSEGTGGLRRVASLGGAVIFLLVAAPWYIAEISVNGMEFIEQFFIKHHFRRYTGVISGHEGPWYYYLPALLIGLMPWIIYLPAGLSGAWRRMKQARAVKDGPPAHSIEVFAMLWFSVIVLFFSFSTTKLPNYILPAIPAASILIACGMSGQTSRQISFSKTLIALVSLLLGIGALVSGRYLQRFGFTDTGWMVYMAVILFAGAALNVAGILQKKSYHGAGAFLMLLFLLLLSFRALPAANNYLQGSLHKYSLHARDTLGKEDALVTYKVNKPSIVFYSGHRVETAGRPEELRAVMESGRRMLVIARAADAQDLREEGFALIEKDTAYALFERK